MNSRKLLFGVGTSIAIVFGGLFYTFYEGFRTGYSNYITGLLGVLGLYVGSNVGGKMAIAKHLALTAAAKAADAKDAKEKSDKVVKEDLAGDRPCEPLPEE